MDLEKISHRRLQTCPPHL